MPPRLLAFLALLLAGIGAGCATPAAQTLVSGPDLGDPRPTVVAIVDTGIDPAHVAFGASSAPRVERHLSTLLQDATLVAREAFAHAADAEERPSLQPRLLYAFEGTNLLGIGFAGPEEGPQVYDGHGHGTRTASLVAREAPHALIVAVKVSPDLCDPGAPCLMDPTAAEGLAWAAAQPWIDVISVSLSVPGNLPDDPRLHPEMQAWLDASRAAHASGKIVVNSAGNDPSLSALDYFNGPPWVICVGAFEPKPRGAVAVMAYGFDVVANFTEDVAVAGTRDGRGLAGGTSYGTPIVAATLAESIFRIRQALDHEGGIVEGALARSPDGERVTSAVLRDALNASARHVAPTDWDPTNVPSDDPIHNAGYQTVPILLPELQMGWGYVDGSLAPEIARRVLEGDYEAPGKERAALFMAQVQAARERWWG